MDFCQAEERSISSGPSFRGTAYPDYFGNKSKCYEAIIFFYQALIIQINFIGVALLYSITLLEFFEAEIVEGWFVMTQTKAEVLWEYLCELVLLFFSFCKRKEQTSLYSITLLNFY